MWKKFIEFIRKLLNKNKQLHSSFLLSDEEVERRLEQQENNLKLLHETIGSNPLDQIDWIIENGYDEYYEKYKSYQDGSIGKKEEVVSIVGNHGYITEEVMHNMTIENVLNNTNDYSGSNIKTFKEMFERVKSEKSIKEDFTLTLEQVQKFHRDTSKGTSLNSVFKQVEKELAMCGIDLVFDNEAILTELISRSIKKFHTSSRTNLDLDVNSGYFKEVLNEEEVGILAKWIAYLYTDNLIKMNERLSSYLSARDYRMTYGSGNANLQKISERFEESARSLHLKYDLEDWTEIRGGIGSRVIHRF